ncbi:ferritin [Streptomonospora wellingtoniae]|uniref:Ferritin n=1 Tax=Streptomonospora wellingtoniae TaxID=3075544 RepID=A0ABU2KPJ5_9ACTN|nr:ferritin [Streptomonospora sp. DSM 45055]MDT0301184.1 ferritin [Streptomonospora sp. DSM 45055]
MNATTRTSEHGLSKFHRLLLDQVGHEFTASHQYFALAAWFDDRDLPGLARVFYRQSLEERDHATMMVRYLIDNGVSPDIPGVGGIETDFTAPRELVALALRQEQRVTEQIKQLAKAARDEHDYTGEQFLNWFLQEQVEEVSTMSTLLNVVDRGNGNMFDVETWVDRELSSTGDADDAPDTAGPSVS